MDWHASMNRCPLDTALHQRYHIHHLIAIPIIHPRIQNLLDQKNVQCEQHSLTTKSPTRHYRLPRRPLHTGRRLPLLLGHPHPRTLPI